MCPQRFLEKAFSKELRSYWYDVYIAVHEENFHINSKVISLHFVYKIKPEENGKKRQKLDYVRTKIEIR